MLNLLMVWTAAAAAGAADDPAMVRWNGREVPVAELGADLGEAPRTAALAWAPFAVERKLELYLSADGRVLLLSPEKRGANAKDLQRIEATLAYADGVLPAPAAAATEGAEAADPPGGVRGGARRDDQGWSYSWSWGAADWERDAETIVLVQGRSEADYGAALTHVAAQHAHLKEFAGHAKALAGCSLEGPLAALWMLEGAGLEEYRPENELVHRLAALLVVRRFGHQPPWVKEGFAWHVEHELLKTHYCFPWRNEFVFATEHTGWDAALKSAHKQTEELAAADVFALRRGSFDSLAAQRAWGAMTFLARFHADGLPGMLEELRLLREEKGRKTKPDGTWEIVVDYEPTVADQEAILERAAGEDVLAEMLAFFQKGKGYKPKG